MEKEDEYPDFIIMSPAPFKPAHNQDVDLKVIKSTRRTPNRAAKATKPAKVIVIDSDSPVASTDEQPKQPKQQPNELNLKCPICLDAPLKDPASTLCGHIFCWRCIQLAIASDRHCPTCRTKLSKKSIHRVYLG